MKIIKLDAIDSTNDYLKKISKEKGLENYTIVVAKYQTNGKGQRKNIWHSENGKNLLFSVLVNNFDLDLSLVFRINAMISLAVFDVLHKKIPNIRIKWPNDIMAGNNKICGILTENIVLNGKIKKSFIGIGINVNQLNFPKELTKVTSISKELNNAIIDIDKLLIEIITRIKYRITTESKSLISEYQSYLFQFHKIKSYKKSNGDLFTGKILGVTKTGKLVVEMIDNSLELFDFKEIVYL